VGALDLRRELSLAVLEAAWRRARSPGGAGIDGVDRARFERGLPQRIVTIRSRVLAGEWQPAPLLRREVAKSGGGTRRLGIPTLDDRVVQGAVLSLVGPRVDRLLLPWVHGYRPGHGTAGAVAQLIRQTGRRPWIELLKVDVEALFDSLEHGFLARCARALSPDPVWLGLECRWRERWASEPGRGIPQGAPLSPMLANLFLHRALDAPLEAARCGLEGDALGLVGCVRYADDLVLASRARGGALVVLRWLDGVLGRAGLRLARRKTRLLAPTACHEHLTVLGVPLRLTRARGGGWELGRGFRVMHR